MPIVTAEGKGTEKAASCCSCNGNNRERDRASSLAPLGTGGSLITFNSSSSSKASSWTMADAEKPLQYCLIFLQVMLPAVTSVLMGNRIEAGKCPSKLLGTEFTHISVCKDSELVGDKIWNITIRSSHRVTLDYPC